MPIPKHLLYLGIVAFTAACSVKDSEEYKTLLAYKEYTEREIRKKDQELEQITRSMAQIENNLLAIRQNEGVIEELRMVHDSDKAGQIEKMVLEIGDYLQKNKHIVNQLEKQVKSALTQNAGLTELLAQQRRAVLAKEAQIAQLMDTIATLRTELKQTVAAKNADIERKDRELTDRVRRLAQKDEIIAAGYYRVGRRKDLMAEQLVRSEGGLLGIGKALQLTNRIDPEQFTRIDTRNFTELSLGKLNQPRMLSAHPPSSYYFVKTEGQTRLMITDPAQFWSVSKFLIIVTD